MTTLYFGQAADPTSTSELQSPLGGVVVLVYSGDAAVLDGIVDEAARYGGTLADAVRVTGVVDESNRIGGSVG